MISAFLISAVVAGFLLFTSPGMVGVDGYYHISIASMIWEEGITFSFPYLEFTLLDQEHYVDMHMLFHLLQSPFTAFLDLEIASKLSATFFIACTFTLFVWLLKKYEVPYPLFWALLLLIASELFLYRMMMSRPPIFALAYTWLAFHFLMQKRFIALAVVACLFVWTYKVFPILIPMAVVAMFVFYVQKKEVDLRPLFAVIMGIIVGMLINPYFPDNIYFLWDAIRMKIFSDGYTVHVGNEWYPMKTLTLIKDAAIPLAAYLLAILLTNRDEWKTDPVRLFWFLMSTMWLLMLFKSRRFIEFFPPAALLFFIFSIRPWLQKHSAQRWLEQRLVWLPALAVALLLIAGAYHTLSEEYERMQGRPPIEAYQGGAGWLAENTPVGSRVFHTDWDDFPRLIFYNRHNTYIVGLDPDYMRLKDARLYERWRNISKGKIKHPEDIILTKFGAEYVITDLRHKGFINTAAGNPRMQSVFSDQYTAVYRVLKSDESQ
ncbi:MAG: hypothetical protein R8K22_02595 [Mariprofundaceae bacterium]